MGEDGGTTERSRARRDMLVLAAGAAAGVALAVYGLVEGDSVGGLPADAAARVNGALIDNTQLADALGALGTDSRDPLDSGDRRWVLDRLIEEELLVQRAVELGLPHSDRAARAALVDAMIRRATRDVVAQIPDDDELARWYGHNFHRFAGAPRLRVQTIVVDDEAAASALAERLRAGAEAASLPAGPTAAGLPDRLLPPAKLRDYLGPTITRRLLDAQTGEWIGPLEYAGRSLVARVAERQPGGLAPLAEIRDQVIAAWQREQADLALERYLDALRGEADIEIAGP